MPTLKQTGWVHQQLVRNQQCKKFSPVKTIKPLAVKTPPPAQPTKQQKVAPLTPVALTGLTEDTVLTTQSTTVNSQTPEKEITTKNNTSTETASAAPDTTAEQPETEPAIERENLDKPTVTKIPVEEPQSAETHVSHAVSSSPSPPAQSATAKGPSASGSKRLPHPLSVIGVIDIQKVINNSARGKAARKKYEALRLAGQQDNIDLAEEELITNVIIEIQAIVETFALQHGFTHILNKNSGAVFYNQSSYNITDDIIREYDRQIALRRITP